MTSVGIPSVKTVGNKGCAQGPSLETQGLAEAEVRFEERYKTGKTKRSGSSASRYILVFIIKIKKKKKKKKKDTVHPPEPPGFVDYFHLIGSCIYFKNSFDF